MININLQVFLTRSKSNRYVKSDKYNAIFIKYHTLHVTCKIIEYFQYLLDYVYFPIINTYNNKVRKSTFILLDLPEMRMVKKSIDSVVFV